MHHITTLLLVFLFLTFTGCEDKEPQEVITIENTDTVLADTAKEINTKPEETSNGTQKHVADTFSLLDTQKEVYTAQITKGGLVFQNNTKPIVLIQLFATWCAPCVGEIAYLNDLQEAYREDLFIAGVLTRDSINTTALNVFAQNHQINYKILKNVAKDTLGTYIAQELDIQGTFPIPLIVIYLKGKYYTHYEGSIPVEMIKYDIQQAKKQL